MDNTIPLFRAPKRRKVVKTDTDALEATETLPRSPNSQTDDDSNNNEEGLSSLLRARQQHRARGGRGIKFSNAAKAPVDEEDADSVALTTVESSNERLQDISSRFVGPTGQVVDTNKHMMAYIDTELAKRQQQASSAKLSTTPSNTNNREPTSSSITNLTKPIPAPQHQTTNQLAEVDLGLTAHQLNLLRTEAARARAESGLPPLVNPEEERKPPRRRKPRIGRDGKPMKPRPPRKRRDSEDIARDALVEQVLGEHRVVDAFGNLEGKAAAATAASVGVVGGGKSKLSTDQQNPTANANAGAGAAGGTAEDADEKLAEQFRQQFMDAAAERRVRNKPATGTSNAKGTEEKSSGPRLGGSRSARAKMMAQQRQQGEQGVAKK